MHALKARRASILTHGGVGEFGRSSSSLLLLLLLLLSKTTEEFGRSGGLERKGSGKIFLERGGARTHAHTHTQTHKRTHTHTHTHTHKHILRAPADHHKQ